MPSSADTNTADKPVTDIGARRLARDATRRQSEWYGRGGWKLEREMHDRWIGRPQRTPARVAAHDGEARRGASRRAVQALVAAGSIEELQHEAPGRAITLYERALAGPADVPGALAALTRRLAVERALRGAEGELALINLLVKKRPGAEYTPYLLVRASRLALEDLSDPARALPPVTAATQDPRWVRSSWLDDALHQRAVVELELGDLDAAERTLRKLIARPPGRIIPKGATEVLSTSFEPAVARAAGAAAPRMDEE
jgi:hypothetical protein